MVRPNVSAVLSRTPTVLLLEDDRELGELLRAELEAAKYHVVVAGNGREGLAYLNYATPDLIVTDVVMPVMGGLEFMQHLRIDPVLCQIPVVMLSSKKRIEDIVRGFDLGADDYVVKPVDPEELLARIGSKIGRPTVPAERLWQDREPGILSPQAFRLQLQSELQRARRVGYPVTAAVVGFIEIAPFPPGADSLLARRAASVIASEAGPLDFVGRAEDGSFLVLMPETREKDAAKRLERVARSLVAVAPKAEGARPPLAPAIGYARAAPGEDPEELLNRARAAQGSAEVRADSRPVRYQPGLPVAPRPAAPAGLPRLLGRLGLHARDGPDLREPTLTRPEAPPPAGPPTRRPSVLLLEDEPDLAERLTADLETAGYSVEQARNGREGLDRLATALPDVIVTDVMMPEMDGLAFMRRMRADPALVRLPVIMLTTRRRIADIVEGFDLGVDDYVPKPVDPAELLARVRAKIARPPVPAAERRQDPQSGFLSAAAFRQELEAEMHRAARAGYPLTVAVLGFAEAVYVREKIGPGVDGPLARQVAEVLAPERRPLDLIGRSESGGYLLLMPETGEVEAERRIDRITERLVGRSFAACGETLHLTPTVGYAEAAPARDADELLDRLRIAQSHAEAHLDLRPARFEDGMVAPPKPARMPKTLRAAIERLRFPAQIAFTFVLGWLVPYGIYELGAHFGRDLTGAAYAVIVVSLVMTCLFIWTEGFLSMKRIDPPDEPDIEYPTASAIIAAYLPNEAATIISTLEAMLRVDYPGNLQIILAYNTPKDMPIEKTLHEMAAKDPRLEVLRVVGSTSKAQNVNAAISYVRGAFTAIYDADHHPDPDSFARAWRWIRAGADVVQGHCLIRNGDASWVARMVAVEFEQIYTVSHPGRARLHNFGIFGGSNGFWRTDLLRRIRMRGSMLTEDIDSALRVVEGGGCIVSDPLLVSRELSPTTFKGLTNQRLRWAQGWYQVTRIRTGPALRAPNLTLRQKIGMFYLLAWRETFPWIAMQIVPIIVFAAVKAGSLAAIEWFVPLFIVITLFVLATGPGQIFFTYRNADPEIKRRRRWFYFYALISVVMYSEYKNLLARVANVKEWMKEKAWKVTARS